MTAPVILFYVLGILFFILGLEGIQDKKTENIIYLGISFLINLMGYLLSYSDTNYTQSAYLPLVFLALTIIVLVYAGIKLIPTEMSWDKQTDDED